nr:hypothetical protein [uncultured Allomuricauda sp.]
MNTITHCRKILEILGFLSISCTFAPYPSGFQAKKHSITLSGECFRRNFSKNVVQTFAFTKAQVT